MTVMKIHTIAELSTLIHFEYLSINDRLMFVTKSVQDLFDEWYRDFIYLPEDGEYIHNVVLYKSNGFVIGIEEPPSITFEELMREIELVVKRSS
ncbi:MAG: hypothetical protein RSC06_14730 [Clostridia bacterium]